MFDAGWLLCAASERSAEPMLEQSTSPDCSLCRACMSGKVLMFTKSIDVFYAWKAPSEWLVLNTM
jgi:hypothetical protein